MEGPENDQGPEANTTGPSPMDDVQERIQSLFPPEFRHHYRAARRELWLAVRALVDSRISVIEAKERPTQQPPKRGRVDITD
jgi:hypothetical protein